MSPGTEANRRPIRVTLFYLPDCPLIDQVRSRHRDCLSRSHARVVVEQLEGLYPSPTLLIDGADVSGNPLLQQPSCRLDLPTEEQILAALARVSGGGEATAKTQKRNPNRSAAQKG